MELEFKTGFVLEYWRKRVHTKHLISGNMITDFGSNTLQKKSLYCKNYTLKIDNFPETKFFSWCLSNIFLETLFKGFSASISIEEFFWMTTRGNWILQKLKSSFIRHSWKVGYVFYFFYFLKSQVSIAAPNEAIQIFVTANKHFV